MMLRWRQLVLLPCVLAAPWAALAQTAATSAAALAAVAPAPNGFIVLERGSFHVERGMVRVCPDLKSVTAPNGQVGCFSTSNKAPLGLAKQFTPEPSLSLEEMLSKGFPNRSIRYTGFDYNKERHEVVVYYRIEW